MVPAPRHFARAAFVLGTAALLASLFLPYWTVRIKAPQYPQGLTVIVYPHHVGGDVREVDGLNHYIGMRPLEHGAPTERRLAVPAIVVTGLCLLLAAWLLNRWSVPLAMPAALLPLLFVADLYWWMRHFGLHLDPHAPLSSAVKPFVPPLLGEGKIAQFHAVAHFAGGFYLALAAALLALAALSLRFWKRHAAGRCAAALLVALVGWASCQRTAAAATRLVGAQAPYATLQEALAAAADGDDIIVQGGRYAGPMVVDKTVRMIGRDAPVLDGGGRGTVLTLNAPGSRVEGFVIRGSGDRLTTHDAGILVNAPDVLVERNRVEDVLFGVIVAQAARTIVRNNQLSGKALPIPRRGDLIRVWYSNDVTIAENRMDHGRDMVLWFSKRLAVRGNSIQHGRYGLHFMYCDDALVEDNRLQGNSVGAYLMYSTRLRLRRNRIVGNRGPSGYGVGFKDMRETVVEDNVIGNNHVGLFLDNTISAVRGNVVAYNDTGVAILPSAEHNEFAGNTFADNGEQVASEGLATAATNRWHDNFWSDYRGYDADGDGTGDLPYEAVQLFERVTDRYPALRLYSGSPAVRTLEFAARLFPLFAPRTLLRDATPRIHP